MRKPALDLAKVRRQLDLSDEAVRWPAEIARPITDAGPVLPDDAEAERLLALLGVDPEDRADVLAARPDPHTHPAQWWVFDRIYRDQLATMDASLPIDGLRGWPALPTSTGAVGRHLYVWLYLAVLPETRRVHAERGIPDDISWASLPIGEALRAHRAMTGESGLGLFNLWGQPVRLRVLLPPLSRRAGRVLHLRVLADGPTACRLSAGDFQHRAVPAAVPGPPAPSRSRPGGSRSPDSQLRVRTILLRIGDSCVAPQ
nr:acyltransferase domain-containing protein [Actinopolymorpha alba]